MTTAMTTTSTLATTQQRQQQQRLALLNFPPPYPLPRRQYLAKTYDGQKHYPENVAYYLHQKIDVQHLGGSFLCKRLSWQQGR